ncbi:hypothetical protein EMCG_03520 [[Emmonsia] crescens]|uniref:UBL3-like ubiquitin domain-containing protein n=1 Tax=[Emmonsia] crescens TaxID=73230 RepID=A0A0G2HVH0_9EURO|nr:hypothetical protein EMCG_03520 [Emmonsia crescens UAMH 3008]
MASSTVAPVRDPSFQSQPEDVEKRECPLVPSKSDPSSIPQDSSNSMAATTANPPSAPALESNNMSSSHPAITAVMDPSHPPTTIEPTEPSDPPGTSTTIDVNTPASLTSQTHDATASQPAPTATTTTTNAAADMQSLQEQTQATAHSISETEESKQYDPAIGPSSDIPSPMGKEAEDSGMVLDISLLLITGARHPFKIDGKYLRKRQVDVPDCNPYAMSVYTLKELIWREWRSEWEPRPSSPSSIRLISFGKLLEDKAPLSDLRLNHTASNVLHMTLKPQEVVDEEDAKAARPSSGRERDGGDHSPRCRCVIL